MVMIAHHVKKARMVRAGDLSAAHPVAHYDNPHVWEHHASCQNNELSFPPNNILRLNIKLLFTFLQHWVYVLAPASLKSFGSRGSTVCVGDGIIKSIPICMTSYWTKV